VYVLAMFSSVKIESQTRRTHLMVAREGVSPHVPAHGAKSFPSQGFF
jgi:hypothetical protein